MDSLPLGNIVFNTPKAMNLYDTAMIELLLGLETPIGELKQLVEAEGAKYGATIQVSPRMQARLSGPNFAITAIGAETQAVARGVLTEWNWEIMPKSTGLQSLHLTLSAILIIEGSDTLRTIRTFDKEIEVEITRNQEVAGFIKMNWEWLWAAIFVPIAGLVWKKRRSRTEQSNKGK